MPRPKKTAPINLEKLEPTCGSCAWRKPWPGEDDFFRCTANPPGVHIDEEGADVVTWPTVDRDDPACRHFRGKH